MCHSVPFLLRTGSRALDLLRVTLLHQCYDALVPWQSDETIAIIVILCVKRKRPCIQITQTQMVFLVDPVGWCRVFHGFATQLFNYTSSILGFFLSARHAAHTSDFFCHGLLAIRNLLRVSATAFLCGALMVLPATGTGVLADWPAGAIYPVTVLLDCSELKTGTNCQTPEPSDIFGQLYILFISNIYIYMCVCVCVWVGWHKLLGLLVCVCAWHYPLCYSDAMRD